MAQAARVWPDARMATERSTFLLDETQIPTQWYNVVPDLPAPPPPPLHPGTREPVGPDDLAPLFPMALIEQEVTEERYVDIPGGVLDVYRIWRPSPLVRARRLEKLLDTPAKIFFKYEGVSPAGSHKPNTAVPQAFYNHQEGVTRLTTETGAGQWGTALAFATAQYGMECEVWQVRSSYDQKPARRTMMEIYGATLHPSPSDLTEAGRRILAEHPDSTGSLGIAISEAVEAALQREDTRYALGSVLNHVLLHQTVIGQEALLQMEQAEAVPDVHRRLHRWRVELRRPRLPVPPREAGRPDGPGDPLRRARRLPVADPGRVPLRLRRHHRHDAAAQDAHPRPRLHPRPDPRRRAALPRHGAAGVAHLRARARRGGGDPAAGVLPGGADVRAHPGHRPGPGADARHRGRDPGGQPLQGER